MMNTFEQIEDWFAKNLANLNALHCLANFGRAGWIWVTLEVGSRVLQARFLNCGRIETVLYDESVGKETFVDDQEFDATTNVGNILDLYVQRLLNES